MKISADTKYTTNMPAAASIHRARTDIQVARREFSVDVKATNPLNGQHGHWTRTAVHRAEHRNRTTSEMLAATVPPLPVRVSLTRYSPGLLDDDAVAASLKSVRDAISDCYGVPDRDPNVIGFVCRQERRKTWGVGVVIEAAGG